MVQVDFKIVQKDDDVTIVRECKSAQKRAAIAGQIIKVMCFDPQMIDRIFSYQELQSVHEETY